MLVKKPGALAGQLRRPTDARKKNNKKKQKNTHTHTKHKKNEKESRERALFSTREMHSPVIIWGKKRAIFDYMYIGKRFVRRYTVDQQAPLPLLGEDSMSTLT